MENQDIVNKRYLNRPVWIMGAAGLLLVGTFVLCTRYKQQHDRLDSHLVYAVLENNFVSATALIKEGADPNARYPQQPFSLRQEWNELFHRSIRSKDGRPTAFSLACGGHNSPEEDQIWRDRTEPAELVLLMLKHGADVNAKSGYDTTPLFWAVRENRPKIVTALLEHGAAVNARDSNGDSPLMDAVRCSPSISQLLLAHGADVNATDQAGFTPLLLAIRYYDDPDTIALLQAHGGSVYMQSREGRSALIYAVLFSESTHDIWTTSVIPQLIAQGANPNLRIRGGTTPLLLARKKNRLDLVAMMQPAKPQR